MKNDVKCPNCNDINSFYKLNCKSCKSFLRARTVNIDLFSTIFALIESPFEAFRQIIYAEHKNLSLILLFLAAFKISILKVSVSAYLGNSAEGGIGLLANLIIGLAIIVIITFLILLIYYVVSKKILKYDIRFSDALAINGYSLFWSVLGLFVLIPIEYAMFGKQLFTFNPSPFLMKPNIAYVLTIIEGLLFLWSFGLILTGFFIQTKNIIIAISTTVMFLAFLFVYILFFPVF